MKHAPTQLWTAAAPLSVCPVPYVCVSVLKWGVCVVLGLHAAAAAAV